MAIFDDDVLVGLNLTESRSVVGDSFEDVGFNVGAGQTGEERHRSTNKKQCTYARLIHPQSPLGVY